MMPATVNRSNLLLSAEIQPAGDSNLRHQQQDPRRAGRQRVDMELALKNRHSFLIVKILYMCEIFLDYFAGVLGEVGLGVSVFFARFFASPVARLANVPSHFMSGDGTTTTIDFLHAARLRQRKPPEQSGGLSDQP
jgi:hypothetical protein